MKINKYCKFLIYFWTYLIFGTAFLIAAILFVLGLGFVSVGLSSNLPFGGVVGSLLGLISGYGIIAVLVVSTLSWFGPTLVLLILGILSAPKEDEDQSGIGKKAFNSAIMVIITVTGLILFLIFSQDEKTKILSFGILIITFVIDGILLFFTFRNEQTDDFKTDAREIKGSDSGNIIGYCSQCGKRISYRDVFCKYCGNKL